MSATIKTSGLLQYKVIKPGTSTLAVNDIIDMNGLSCADSFTGLKVQRVADKANIPVSFVITGDWTNVQRVGQAVDITGLVFTVTMLDGTTKTVTPTSYSPQTWSNTAGTQTCTFTYTESEITFTASKDATVQEYTIDSYITFTPASGTVTVTPSKYWSATTVQYSVDNGSTWTDCPRTIISEREEAPAFNTYSYSAISGNSIKFRAIGGYFISSQSASSSYEAWGLVGTNISCTGNIETLLDYQAVGRGEHPTSRIAFCSHMFCDCTNLVAGPSLPCTTVDRNAFYGMFSGCTSLITIPNVYVLTIASMCFAAMFSDCTSLKISETQTEECPNAYRIPAIGTATVPETVGKWSTNMFKDTSGTFVANPTINTTYYTNATLV